MNNYFHSSDIESKYIKEFNQKLSSTIKTYTDKNQVIPTKVFVDYCTKIDNISSYVSAAIQEYQDWFNETVSNFMRNRSYVSFKSSSSFDYNLLQTYLEDKQKATLMLIKALKEQNKPEPTKPKKDKLLTDLSDALSKGNINKQDILDLIKTLSN